MAKFTPTAEQANAVDLFNTGQGLAIEARAGTGKTSTLELLANAMPGKVGRYVAFNKSIATEAGKKFPDHVACSTAHSLAMRSVGQQYRHRLNTGRMTGAEIARRLAVSSITVDVEPGHRKSLAAGFLAGRIMQAVGSFCQSADTEIGTKHFGYIDGIDLPTGDGRKTYGNNDEVRRLLLPAARQAWRDLADPQGQLPYKHDHYLKAWHLADPQIPCDVLFFDEAQDANPVLLDIVSKQAARGVQLVFVGDSEQQIYEFTGAVNALSKVPAELRAYLSQSFRFGPAVAEMANVMLDRLGAVPGVTGLGSIESQVGPVQNPDAVLCRTNAKAVETVLDHQRDGQRVHLIGGSDEVTRFAKAADELRQNGRTYHPELACFESWGEVQDYVDNDPQGSDLRLLVTLVDDYGTDQILAAFDRTCSERDAQVVVSTAHKSKGREWSSVQLAADFHNPERPPMSESDAELRLLYVAATRAQHRLDVTRVPAFKGQKPPAPVAAGSGWFDTVTGAPIPHPDGVA